MQARTSTYDWDFGDGVTGSGPVVTTHTYETTGAFTAVVTASNTLNSLAASTPVTVAVPVSGLTLIKRQSYPVG